jgi:cell fate (sporulation/competence/biofilm development) regulator YmcA (YheA/YmcA/DUF963 family)
MESFKPADKVIEEENMAVINCEEISQVDFSLPANVEFTDQCEALKKVKEQTKKLQENMGNLPLGVNLEGQNLPQ